jgi:hypothetical protein
VSPLALVLAFAALATSARTVVNLPVLGPVPVLGVVALAVVLVLAALVLWIVRLIVRDAGLRRRPVTS